MPRPGQPPPEYTIRVDPGSVWYGDGRIRADRGPDGLKITRMTLPPVSDRAPPARRVRCCSSGERV